MRLDAAPGIASPALSYALPAPSSRSCRLRRGLVPLHAGDVEVDARNGVHLVQDFVPRRHFGRNLHLRCGALGKAMEAAADAAPRTPASGSEGHGGPPVAADVNLDSSGLVPPEVAASLVEDALVWASLHGLLVGDKNVENSGKIPGVGLGHAPLSLLPAPITKDAFLEAVELAPLFNTLVDRVAADGEFLEQVHARTRLADPFTDRLLAIHANVISEGLKPEAVLGLNRSDYMLDMPTGLLLQVEINTISSSFAGLAPLISALHKYLVGQLGDRSILECSKVPDNKADHGYAEALALAWDAYGHKSAAVLFVVQPDEKNMYDQHWLAFRLYDSYGVRSIRRTLAEIYEQGTIDDDGTLLIEEQAVSVVYFRAGYTPTDYPSESEWVARLLLERSRAIKCPSIAYHLAGTKKVQQELAKPGVVERFLPSADAKKLRRCFAGLWGLEDEGAEAIIEQAISDPDKFVLKPQREGGGNNLYGEDVRTKLLELKAAGGSGLAAYILQQRISPPVHMTYLVRQGTWNMYETVSEVGIYGAYLRHGERVLLNRQTGHLVRTKVSSSSEGGVVAGYGVLDSPYLI